MPRFSPDSSAQIHAYFQAEKASNLQAILEQLDEIPELQRLIVSTLLSSNPDTSDEGFKLLVILSSLPREAEERLMSIPVEGTSLNVDHFRPIAVTESAQVRLEEQQIRKLIDEHPEYTLTQAYFEIYGKHLDEYVRNLSTEAVHKSYNKSISNWYHLLHRALPDRGRFDGVSEKLWYFLTIEDLFNLITIQNLLNGRNIGVKKVIQLFQKMHWFDQRME